jgi:carboxyl-terminal processing protease
MRWLLAILVLSAAAQAPAPEDRAAQLEPFVRKFTDVLSILQEYGADAPTLDPAINQGALPGMLKTLDPHSIFFDPDNFKQLQEMETSVRRGFGTIVSLLPGRVIILQVQAGSPSARAGLQPGDSIIAINSIALAQLDTDQLVGLLGQARTIKVKLDVHRQNTPRLLEFVLSPEAIDTPSVERIFTAAPGIGYLRVGGFEVKTGKDIHAAIEKLGGANLKGLVLDLRNNPGGVVGAAIETASLFLNPGQRIFSIRGRSKEPENIDVAATAKPYSFPLAVLVNEKSASASEIIAAAMQEQHRGFVIGQPTYGKGLVQNVFPLSNKSGLALTVAYYYTPEGRSLQRPLRDSQIDANLSTTAGGLKPAYPVEPEAQTRLRVALDASGSFTTFATDYIRREKVAANFEVSNSLLDTFRSWLIGRRIQPSVTQWVTDTGWIRSRLRQEILNQGVSVERGDEVELARDPLMIRALDLIRAGKIN